MHARARFVKQLTILPASVEFDPPMIAENLNDLTNFDLDMWGLGKLRRNISVIA